MSAASNRRCSVAATWARASWCALTSRWPARPQPSPTVSAAASMAGRRYGAATAAYPIYRPPCRRRALSAEPAELDDTVAPERFEFAGTEAKPIAERFGGVFAEQRRRFDRRNGAVEPHRPGRHRHFGIAVPHLLQNAAVIERRLIDEIVRIED